MIGIQEEFFPTHGLTAFGVHPSGCLPPVNTLKRGHQTRLEPVSAAAFHDAVALARLILHDLESTAQARMARSGLDNALRRLNNTQTEAMRLRRELRWRLPDSLATSCTYIRQVEDDTKAGKLWQWQEDILTTAEIVNEGLTHFNDLVYTGGSTMIDGTCVYSYTGGQPQLSINLSFGWVNTSSGQPTTTGPAVGSVAYYMWDGVDDPNIFPDSWPLLGTSTDAASGFSLTYTGPTQEGMFMAVPYDTSDNLITIPDPDGDNAAWEVAAVTIPEPSIIALLATATAILLPVAWRKRKAA